MFRSTSVVAFGLALGLVTAPLAFAEEVTKAPEASKMQAQTPTSPAASAKAKTASSKHMTSPRVDLNTASRDELIKLPGIDGATADKIVEARPFKSKSELRSKGIVTKAEYGKIAAHVTAKPAMAAGK
jgi:competence protein ComEA